MQDAKLIGKAVWNPAAPLTLQEYIKVYTIKILPEE